MLFPEMEDQTPPKQSVNTQKEAKKLLRSLYKIRQKAGDNPLLPKLNNLIDEIRNFQNFTDSQIQEKILYAIEKQMSWTLSEIVEDTGIERKTVERILNELKDNEVVRFVPRYIPGSDRQYYLIKSNRQDVPEMSGIS